MSHTTNGAPRPHPVAARLRATLDALAQALAHAQLDAMLVCETELAASLSEFHTCRSVETWDRAATVRELRAARAALTHCRRLGASLGDATRLALAVQGRGHGYGRPADRQDVSTAHSLEARV